MAVGLESWDYILRGCIAVAFLAIIIFGIPLLSSIAVGDAKSYKHPLGFLPLLIMQVVLHFGNLIVLIIWGLDRGELPDRIAAGSLTCCAMMSAAQLEQLATLKKVKLSVSCIYVGFWGFLSTAAFLTIIRLCLQPSSLSPYPQFGITSSSIELMTYVALSVLFYHATWGKYERLNESDTGNYSSESTRHSNHNVFQSESSGRNADPLAIRMEVRREVEELGGWWNFIKRNRIFLKFMYPFDDALLQLRFGLTLLLVVAGRLLDVYEPLLAANVLDALISGGDPWRPLFLVIAVDVGENLASSSVSLLWTDVHLHRRAKLTIKVQSKIMNLDFWFHTQVQATDVIKAVDNAGSVDKLLDSIIFGLGPNLVTFIFAIVQIAYRYEPEVGFILAQTLCYYYLVERRYVAAAIGGYDKCKTLRDEQERRRQDSVRGWNTISNHNRVTHEMGLYSSAVKSWMSQRRRYEMTCSFFNLMQSGVLSLGYYLCYAEITNKIYSREAPVGSLIAFIGLWRLLTDPIDYFTSFVQTKTEEFLDTASLRRILERTPSTPNGDLGLKRETGKIEFRDISFSYPGSERVIIDHLSMVIEGGSTVAFVGKSGTGKSTICNLLMRNLVPTAGTILIDNQDITTLSKDSLHENVAIMTQSPYIFNDTVAQNVRYPNLKATDEEMHEACSKAGIHEVIMAREDRYETLMGDGGQNFSGGERQRILLSRLFLDGAKIKIIDEGTSALDAETEASIKQSIEEGLVGETVIIVAHRLSSIRHADRIFVLGINGKITEHGTHDELVVKNGEYAKLWRMHIGEKVDVGDTGDLIEISAWQ